MHRHEVLVKMADGQDYDHGDNPHPSHGSSRQVRNKSKEQPVLGPLEAFWSLVYKINSKDQSVMYRKTTEKLVDHVTITYGKDMPNLIKWKREKKNRTT